MIKLDELGSLNGEIIVNGTQGHVAYPENVRTQLMEFLKFVKN